jgi:Pentapeptide repeats (8 copies)
LANPEHLKLLQQAVDVWGRIDYWNAWRAKDPSIVPDLIDANLRETELSRANLMGADLSGADLFGSNLNGAQLVETNLIDATLTDCRIYGISAWNVKLSERTKQQGLIITRAQEPEITVDDLEVAQFVYLLLDNEKIRRVIDTITSKVVLILGRFTPERKAVLDAIREELRNRHYVPILFDFDVPAGRDITETVSLLARMARFIIADLTDPSSIPKELEAIVPQLAVPVQPLLEGDRPTRCSKTIGNTSGCSPSIDMMVSPRCSQRWPRMLSSHPNRK